MSEIEEKIGEGIRRGSVSGALIAFGPDLTVAEWAEVLDWPPSRVRALAKSLDVETRGVKAKRERDDETAREEATRLAEAIEGALELLAFGEPHKARRMLRAAIAPR